MEPVKPSNKRKPTNKGSIVDFFKKKTAFQDVGNRQPQPPNLQPVAETGQVILEKKAPAKSQQDSSPVPCDYLDKKENTAHQDVETRQPQPPNLQPVAEPGRVIPVKKAPAKSQQDLSPVPRDTLDKKEKEPHATHSFEWCWSDKKPTTFTCDEAGTIEESLMRSSQFKEIAGKNRNKELVVLRDGKAISSHFPCSLIKNAERLIVKYFKAVDKPKQQVSGHRQRVRPSSELVTFHVLTKGGKGVKNIMRNSAFKTDIEDITVYAYKGEKVKQALRRDGRFLKTLFKKNCGLSDTSTEVITEISNLVDDLDGKNFKIILLNKSVQPDSQPGSLDDAIISESQRSDADGNQDTAHQSTSAESVNDNTSEEKPKMVFLEIPNSKELNNQLSSEFERVVKKKKTQRGSKPSRIQDLFRVDYRNSTQTYNKVGTLKTLMDLSNFVCQVRINGNAVGSGFLLFGKFVLTNAHVVEGIFDMSTGQLHEMVTVHFCFESLGQMDSGIAVEEVAGLDFCPEPGHISDWALLRLPADQKVPDGLLTCFGFLPQSGGICIVGHPSGDPKEIDQCLIVPHECQNQVVEKHYHENPQGVLPEKLHFSEYQGSIQYLTQNFFEGVAKSVQRNKQLLTYKSCFYHGSSGSPVFDEHCNVVAMHSGGYVYQNATGQRKSVIEFGFPLSGIIERILVQVVERRRFDVLKDYLACNFARRQNVMDNLKKLVESRNLTAFKQALNSPLVKGDESLKKFLEFLCLKEEPVPMETDRA